MSKPKGYIVHCWVCGEPAEVDGKSKRPFLEKGFLRKYWRYNQGNCPAAVVYKYTCRRRQLGNCLGCISSICGEILSPKRVFCFFRQPLQALRTPSNALYTLSACSYPPFQSVQRVTLGNARRFAEHLQHSIGERLAVSVSDLLTLTAYVVPDVERPFLTDDKAFCAFERVFDERPIIGGRNKVGRIGIVSADATLRFWETYHAPLSLLIASRFFTSGSSAT